MTVSIGQDYLFIWVIGSQFKGCVLGLSEPALYACAQTIRGIFFLPRFLCYFPQIKGFECWTATPPKGQMSTLLPENRDLCISYCCYKYLQINLY